MSQSAQHCVENVNLTKMPKEPESPWVMARNSSGFQLHEECPVSRPTLTLPTSKQRKCGCNLPDLHTGSISRSKAPAFSQCCHLREDTP
jgi:hypothetical protein